MYTNSRRFGIGRSATVMPGIRLHGVLDQQAAGRDVPLLGDQADAAAGRVEIDHSLIMRPRDGRSSVRRVLNETGEIYSRALVDENVRTALDLGDWF
ncbi:hypothetical protein WA026_022266 [Henosepilachna vigintioctopunctata]|uniref:Uncharacterized protein n=1 Tax=Henosepilachna vigintioctopunctata TaxID=420089 RepID=A0AAW1USW3_9CUCU